MHSDSEVRCHKIFFSIYLTFYTIIWNVNDGIRYMKYLQAILKQMIFQKNLVDWNNCWDNRTSNHHVFIGWILMKTIDYLLDSANNIPNAILGLKSLTQSVDNYLKRSQHQHLKSLLVISTPIRNFLKHIYVKLYPKFRHVERKWRLMLFFS